MEQWIYSAGKFRELFFYLSIGILLYVVARCFIASFKKEKQLKNRIQLFSLILMLSTLSILKFDLLALIISVLITIYLTTIMSSRLNNCIGKFIQTTTLTLSAISILFLATGNSLVLGYGPSMWPAVSRGYSVAIVNRSNNNIYRGAEIAFSVRGKDAGHDEATEWLGGQYHKRVVGLPGDIVEVGPYTIKVNNELIADCHPNTSNTKMRTDYHYAWFCSALLKDEKNQKTTNYTISWGAPDIWMAGEKMIQTWTIKDGELFVIGDNLIESADSRDRGPIKQKWVSGVYY